jgi:large subunit ribosomal protein L1
VRIGSEAQDPKEILDNALAVLEEVNRRFPLRQYLDDIYIKKTMGPPVKIRAAEALVK